jgi:soluble lytic murein transglycosylase-like protein
LIKSVAIENKVDPALLAAMVEVESKFNPTAVSKTGAMGLMQLMPPTARELGVKNPFSPEESLKGGARYIKQLLDDYNGDVNKALAAYNYGPGNLKRSNILPLETRAYVNNVLKARTKYLAQASTTPGMV